MDVLTNKQHKSYSKLSRYATFPYYYHTDDNKYIYGTTTHLDTSTSFTLHMVEKGDTPDTLALKYYHNPVYYWVILDFNRIQDPFAELTVGMYLKIPTLAAISFFD